MIRVLVPSFLSGVFQSGCGHCCHVVNGRPIKGQNYGFLDSHTGAFQQPLAGLLVLSRTRRGCIVRSKPRTLRRTLPENPDQILTKLRRTGATAGGLRTDASERVFSVRCVGPTAAAKLGFYGCAERLRLRRSFHGIASTG